VQGWREDGAPSAVVDVERLIVHGRFGNPGLALRELAPHLPPLEHSLDPEAWLIGLYARALLMRFAGATRVEVVAAWTRLEGAAAERHLPAWVAIACTTDEAWATLADVIGRADLAGLTRAERHTRHDELDQAIAAWTATQDYMDAMHLLQGKGVPAHVVANAPEFLVDPQIAHREHFVEVGHGKQGTTFVEGTRFKLSRTPAAFTYGAPTFGEHTFEILTGTLGYDGDRIAELAAAELLE